MMPKFHPDYAVEIVAPEYGSAYRIGGRLVLTCKHLFDDDNRCKVRFRSPSNYSGKQDIDAEVIWKAPDNIDIALIELPETIETCDPVSFGQLPDANSSEKVGFDFFCWPSWGFVNLEDRNKATGLHIDGIIYLADRSASGLLTLEANRTPSELEVEQCNKQRKSPWQGASGSSIIVNGLAVGVLRWHPNPDRPASLEAELLTRVYDHPEWRNLLEQNGIDPNPITTGLSPENETRLRSRDPLSQIRDYVPTEFELLDTDFYENQQGENVPILNLPSATKNWTLITQGNYIDRDQQDDFLDLAQELKSNQGISFLLIEGKPGAGKTALMKWLTYQLSQEGEIVLRLRTMLRWEDYNWLYSLSEFSHQIQQKSIYLMVDDLFRNEDFFLRNLEDNDLQFPLIIIGTTRINENQQERSELSHYKIKSLTLELNSGERERFLQEIRHKDKKADKRLNQLSRKALNKLKNAPTLLVLLLQLSEGKPFDQIIASVIQKLPDKTDSPVYTVFGVICAFYQYGTVIYPDIIKLCLPNYSPDAIDNVINIGLETDLKGLVQKEIRAGYEGLTAIHQDIAYHAMRAKFIRRNNENSAYHQSLVEKYLRIAIPQLESKKETHERWFAPQLRSLMIYDQTELVNKILIDFPDKIKSLQTNCSITILIRWQTIYFLFNLQEDVKRCINLIIKAETNNSYEYQYRLSLIEKAGTNEQIKEAITQTKTWLKSHLNDLNVRQQYLALIEKQGTNEQIKEAITETKTWLKSHLDDNYVRHKYLVLIEKQGTNEQIKEAITETKTWLKSHLDDLNVRQKYLALIEQQGTNEHIKEAITETKTWLQSHLDNVNVREKYLALIERQGTNKQIQEAIAETEIWLQSHLDDSNVRKQYLTLLGKAGKDLVDIQSLLPQQFQWIKQQSKVKQYLWDSFLPVLYHHGKVEDYPEMIQLALQQYPDNRSIIVSIFGYYRDYLDYETCFKLADFLQFARLPVDKWQNKVHSANFFRDYGELERAEKLYRSMINRAKNKIKTKKNKSLERTLDFATLNYAYLLLLSTPPKWNEAIKELDGLLLKEPKHSLIHLYLAKAYQAKAKSYSQSSSKQIYQQAIFHYEEAIQYDKRKNGYFWYKFGCFYREIINDIPQAINCFNNSLEQNIDLCAAIELAEIELQRGNKQKAQTILQPALELPLKTRPEREQRERLTPRINAILTENNSELT